MRNTAFLCSLLLLTSCFTAPVINSYEECVSAGYEMYLFFDQCTTPNGRIFNRKTGKELPIRITHPTPNATVQLPIRISGMARGSWFFEATFPISIEDQSGNILFKWYAQAVGDWMTEEFVVFDEEFEVDIKEKTKAFLIAHKSNASGLPEHDAEVRVPIILLPDNGTSALAQRRAAIENYLRSHIAEISPTNPVLGGHFFVTDIRWLPSEIAVVDYEDGHIALTIHVLANVDQSDVVSVQEVIDVSEEVLPVKRFEGKVVYGMEGISELKIEKLRMDCAHRNGNFEECGSPCASKTEVCITVCAYTCTFEEKFE